MTSLIMCLLPSGATAALGNKHKINDVIISNIIYYREINTEKDVEIADVSIVSPCDSDEVGVWSKPAVTGITRQCLVVLSIYRGDGFNCK